MSGGQQDRPGYWREVNQRRSARKAADHVAKLASTDHNMRLAIEVMPANEVIEAMTKLLGADLYAKRCGYCNEWYCIRENEVGSVRRVEANTKYCSHQCTQRAGQKAYQDRKKGL